MSTSWFIGPALAALPLALGCGGGGIGDPPGADAGLPDADLSGAPDLSRASWEIEPVEGSGDSGFDPKMSVDPEGRALVVWQKNDASAIGFGVRDPGDGSWNVGFISPPEATAVFSPDVAGAADGAHIVFSGSTVDTGEDIFYVHWDGAEVSQATNLTAAGQASNDTDFSPAVAVTPTGTVSVFYSHSTDPSGFNAELNALSFTDPASAGMPTTLLPSASDCGQARARADADGKVHAVALCTAGGDSVAYLSDRSGKLGSQAADFSATDSMVAPDIDIDSRGMPHITVQGSVTCGGSSCSDPFYSVNLAPATPVTGAVNNYFSPSLALDAFDRPIIVFFDLPDRNLLWTFRDQAGFFRPQMVAPTAEKVIGTGDTDPESGLPWFTFEDRTGAADVIWIARLVP